jgi:hypothetical protein
MLISLLIQPLNAAGASFGAAGCIACGEEGENAPTKYTRFIKFYPRHIAKTGK